MHSGHAPSPVEGGGEEDEKEEGGGEMEMEDGGGIRDRQKEGEKRKGGRREKEREADREQNFVCLLATENVMSCKEDRCLCPYLPEDRGHVDLLLTTHNP